MMKLYALVLGTAVVLGISGCDQPEERSQPGSADSEFRTLELQAPLDAVAVPVPSDAVCSIAVRNHGTKSMETDYLPNVLACEAPGGAGLEMLKAQAVAARSYAYYHAIANGQICNGQGCQVFSCGRQPSALHRQAVAETSGLVLRYNDNLTIGFYVAGDSSPDASCRGNSAGVGNTERYVTYNEGLSETEIVQTRIAWRHRASDRDWGQNRGALSQWGANCLADDFDYDAGDILRYYYGDDIEFQQTQGDCVTEGEGVDGSGGDDDDGTDQNCGVVSAEGETIIDNGDACFGLAGPAEYWRTENAGHGGTLNWTKSTRVTESNIATWTLNFAQAGLFRIEAHIDPSYSSATTARYEVVDADHATELEIDQTVGGWVNLGVYDFDAGAAGQQLRLSDVAGVSGQQLQADAVRLTPVDDEECTEIDCRADDPSAGPAPDARGAEESGGCSVAGGWTRPPSVALLLLLGLLGRRRKN